MLTNIDRYKLVFLCFVRRKGRWKLVACTRVFFRISIIESFYGVYFRWLSFLPVANAAAWSNDKTMKFDSKGHDKRTVSPYTVQRWIENLYVVKFVSHRWIVCLFNCTTEWYQAHSHTIGLFLIIFFYCCSLSVCVSLLFRLVSPGSFFKNFIYYGLFILCHPHSLSPVPASRLQSSLSISTMRNEICVSSVRFQNTFYIL